MTGQPLAGRRILIVVENLPVPFDRRVWQEAQALAAAGARVAVICPQMKGETLPFEARDGIEIHRHPLREAAGSAAGYLREYAQALFWQTRLSFRVRRRMGGLDAIQGCSPPDLIFLVVLLHRLRWGTPYIFDHHDLSPELFETKFGTTRSGTAGLRARILGALLRWAERRSFRNAAVTVATNATFKAIAVERGGKDPADVFVVKSYPDLARFRRTAPDPGLTARGPKLAGWVGIAGAQDGVDMLIRAMAVLCERGRDDVAAVIVGDGPELPALRALAGELGLGAAVVFTGYLKGEALLAALSALAIGVIPDPPNPFNDKLSMNKVFEYMMLGLPFVLFDLAEARAEAGGAGLVAAAHTPEALADAMLALLDDPARAQAMGARGRAEAEARFRWEGEAATLVAAHARAMGLPAPAAAAGEGAAHG